MEFVTKEQKLLVEIEIVTFLVNGSAKMTLFYTFVCKPMYNDSYLSKICVSTHVL